MKESAKRILALVLSFVMIFTSLPVIANAATDVTLIGANSSYTIDRTVGDHNLEFDEYEDDIIKVERVSSLWDNIRIRAKKPGTSSFTYKEYIEIDYFIGKYKKYTGTYTVNVTVKEAETQLSVKEIPTTMIVGEEVNDVASVRAKQNDFFVEPTITMTSSDSDVVEVVNNKIVAKAAGKATISISASNGQEGLAYTGAAERKYEITVLGEKEKVTQNIDVKWGETKNITIFSSNDWIISNNVCLANIKGLNNDNVARVDNKTTVKGLNIGSCTFTAEDRLHVYIVNVNVICDDEESIDILVGDKYYIGSDGIILDNDANIYAWRMFDTNIATGEVVNDGLLKDKCYVVTGVSEGTTYLWKKYVGITGIVDGNEYVFQVNVKDVEKVDLILDLEDEDAELIKEDFCEKNTELTNDFKAQILEEVEDKLTNYDKESVSIDYDNDGNIVVKADLNRFTVKFVYEQDEVTNFVDVKYGSTLTEENMTVVERYINSKVATLNRQNPDYTYTFEGFDKDLTQAITENTDVNVIIKKVEKEKITIIAAYKFYDEYKKCSDIAEEYRYKVNGNENSYKLSNTSAHFDRAVYGKIENGKLVEQDKDEATNLILVYWSKKADIKFVDVEGNEIKNSVIGLEDFNYDYSVFNGWNWNNKSELSGNEKTDLEQTEKMWKLYAKNISIDDENEYKFKNAKIDSYNEKSKYNYNYPVITLVFEKAIKKPVNVKHVLYFEGQAVKTVKEEVKSVIYENGEEVSIISRGKVNEAYKKYALKDGYTLDEFFSGSDCMTYDFFTNTITYRYWAKRITVAKAGQYNVMVPGFGWWIPEHKEPRYFNPMTDREVIYVSYNELKKLDTNKKTYEDLTLSNGKNIYDGFESAGELYKVDNVSVFLEPNESLATGEFYKATITLTYVYDVQGNCKHKDVEYIDNEDGKTHKVVCTDCESVIKDNERHTFDRETHKCVCGAKDPNRVITIENIEIDLPEGLVSITANSLYNYTLANACDDIAYAINEAEEEEMSKLPQGTSYAKVSDKDVEKVITAMENDFVSYIDTTNNGYVVGIIEVESWFGYFYKVKVNFNFVEGKFNQIEIKNDLNRDSIARTVIQTVGTNKKVNKDMLGTAIVSGQTLEYGEVYEAIAIFVSEKLPNDSTQVIDKYEFKGKVHLYHGSNKKKKKNTDLPDGLLPQGGAGIADLRTNRPDDMLTRSEFIGVLSEIFTVLDTENYKDFADINGDANELAIKKLSSFGIVQGYCEDTFGPNDYITREQMYTFIARALKFSGKASGLTDEQIDAALDKVLDGVNVADWAEEGVAISIEKELVTEDEKAQDTIKRVEAADKLEKFAAILYSSEEKAE